MRELEIRPHLFDRVVGEIEVPLQKGDLLARESQFGPELIDEIGKGPRVQLEQEPAGFDPLVVLHVDGRDDAVDLWSDLGDVRLNVALAGHRREAVQQRVVDNQQNNDDDDAGGDEFR